MAKTKKKKKKKQGSRKGVSRAQWLKAALKVIETGSVSDVKVESLARDLGISKSGFYWHFIDRDDLLRQVLKYWVREFTEVIARNTEMYGLEGGERVRQMLEAIVSNELARYDLGIRQWAQSDAMAARAVKKADRERRGFIKDALIDYGMTDREAEARMQIILIYGTWEVISLRSSSKVRRSQLAHKLADLVLRR